MKDAFLGLNDRLYQACVWVSGLAIVVMALIIPWGIFTRYVLGSGSQWPEPISILLMVLFTFLGSAAGYRAGAHIAVAMITDRLPVAVQRPLAVFITVLMGLVAAFMLFYGTHLCTELWGQSLAELPWMRAGAGYLPVPVAGFVTLLFVIERLTLGNQNHRAIVQSDSTLET